MTKSSCKRDTKSKSRYETSGGASFLIYTLPQSANLNAKETFLWLAHATTYLSTPCGNHATHFQPRIIF